MVRPSHLLIVGLVLLGGATLSALMTHSSVSPVMDEAGTVVSTRPNPAFTRTRRITWALAVPGSTLIAGAGVLWLKHRRRAP